MRRSRSLILDIQREEQDRDLELFGVKFDVVSSERASYDHVNRAIQSSDLLIAPVGSITSVDAIAPPGVYYVRVRAANGNSASGTSNEIVVAVR